VVLYAIDAAVGQNLSVIRGEIGGIRRESVKKGEKDRREGKGEAER
jgi:hypothetical protein